MLIDLGKIKSSADSAERFLDALRLRLIAASESDLVLGIERAAGRHDVVKVLLDEVIDLVGCVEHAAHDVGALVQPPLARPTSDEPSEGLFP